ncbi:MAG: endolytic transglycosylase MltG [Candidatus Cloacimonadales bacterium]
MHKKIQKLIPLIIFVIFIVLLLFEINSPIVLNNQIFVIENGQSARTIAENLYNKGLIRSTFAFNVVVRLKNCDKQLKHGSYLFNGKISIKSAIEKIVSGEIEVKQITIPEGLSMYATTRLISNYNLGSLEIMNELINDSTFAKKITGFDVNTLEGFLYPDTYIFNVNYKEDEILSKMVNNLFARLHRNKISFEDKEKFYDILKMASIVEKEAVFNDEKPVIASVYYNRLKKKMRLQADPTSIYHLEEKGIKKGKLYYKDVRKDTPHNTYTNYGLPPTPICSPSISTIKASINPADTNYLFFFATPDRRHIFTTSYKDHLNQQKSKI